MAAERDGKTSVVTGRSPRGVAFKVPATRDMFHTLLSPPCWGPSELFTLLCSLLILLSALLRNRIPYAFYVAQFAFWRLSYNVGLGLLLRAQSDSRAITTWLSSRSPQTHALLSWAVTKSLAPSSYAWSRSPPCFNAWIVFRALATLILTNDGVSYAVLVFASWSNNASPSSSSSSSAPSTLLPWLLFFAINFPVAALLATLSTWAKAAAHTVLSDYAWFWGDFFFTIDANLTFDGVFNLVPHPMYTAGYGAYYAAALITRSHALFQISLLAHLSQLIFLAFIEHPHIRKTYGPPSAPPTDTRAPAAAAVTSTALRRGAVAVAVLCAAGRPPAVLSIALTLAYAATHWLDLAGNAAAPRESDSAPAARLRHGLFALCALRLGTQRGGLTGVLLALLPASPAGRSALLLGATVAALCARGWYTALHERGSPAGSATAQTGAGAQELRGVCVSDADGTTLEPQSGPVTRFLSRPLLVLPYVVYYGVALAVRSPTAFGLAAALHVMHLLAARGYHLRSGQSDGSAGNRADAPGAPMIEPTPLERKLLGLPGASAAQKALLALADRVMPALSALAGQMRVRGERARADVVKQRDAAMRKLETAIADAGLRAVASVPDGSRCVEELGRRGLKVERVEPMCEE